jgi:hypothetical protein
VRFRDSSGPHQKHAEDDSSDSSNSGSEAKINPTFTPPGCTLPQVRGIPSRARFG